MEISRIIQKKEKYRVRSVCWEDEIMKMKKVMAVVLAAAMTMTMAAGCGKEKEKEKSDVIKIGSIGPLTGDAAIYGNDVKGGIEIAIKEINEAGGINGAKVELNFQDDENDPEKAVNAYNNLKDWGMQAEVIADGYFHESEYRSAPYFDLDIDGITLLNTAF